MLPLRRLIRELQRKGFHFSGLIIPLVYYLGLRFSIPGSEKPWLTKETATWIVGIGTGIYLVIEMVRLTDPTANRLFVRLFRVVLRRQEVQGLTGTAYYLYGAFLSMLLFPPIVAIVAMMFLVFGDFAAALVGTSIGRIRIFPPRSLEGSAGCLLACLAVGLPLLWHVKPVWPVAVGLTAAGAVAATVSECLPWRMNDNLTIPLVSGFALRLAAHGFGVTDLTLPW
mgnify:CR=1 FL=1|jgi:diacylglycerol kinase (CTP)